jgi:hypothetical protein
MNCASLKEVYFLGNAPDADSTIFVGSDHVTVIYLPGATGWKTTFGGVSTIMVTLKVATTDGGFGIRANRFGFNIAGVGNQVIVVDVCTNLSGGAWMPLQTNLLVDGACSYSEILDMNAPIRLYRVRAQ